MLMVCTMVTTGKVDIQIVFYATVFNVNLILYPIAVVGFKNK